MDDSKGAILFNIVLVSALVYWLRHYLGESFFDWLWIVGGAFVVLLGCVGIGKNDRGY